MSGNITLKDLILKSIEDFIRDNLYTAIPAAVIAVGEFEGAQTVDVKPLVRKLYKDGVILETPIIQDVPVVFPSGGGALLSMPIAKGDTVLVVFSMRSIDEWLNSNGREITPFTTRQFNITDAIAIPGLFTKSTHLSPSGTDAEFKFNTAKFKLQPDDKIALGANGVEVLQLISDLLQALIDARTPTAIGMQPLATSLVAFESLKSQVDSIKGEL